MNNGTDSWGFTPSELRKLRALKTPHGIQRALDAMPYHLQDTAWSPRRVLAANTSHCYEGALFAAAALRVNGFPPLIIDFEAEHDTDHVLASIQNRRALGSSGQVELHWVPVSRAGVPVAARAGAELFRCLLQSARRADAAVVFASGAHEALRSSPLDDDRQAGLVCGRISADDFAYSADFACAGQAPASSGWKVVSGGVAGAGGEVTRSQSSVLSFQLEPWHPYNTYYQHAFFVASSRLGCDRVRCLGARNPRQPAFRKLLQFLSLLRLKRIPFLRSSLSQTLPE